MSEWFTGSVLIGMGFVGGWYVRKRFYEVFVAINADTERATGPVDFKGYSFMIVPEWLWRKRRGAGD